MPIPSSIPQTALPFDICPAKWASVYGPAQPGLLGSVAAAAFAENVDPDLIRCMPEACEGPRKENSRILWIFDVEVEVCGRRDDTNKPNPLQTA